MRIIKLTISYDGTDFKGWQIQKNGPSIQEELEKALKKIFKKKIRLHGSGRTDSGVHAKGQVAHFKTPGDLPLKNIQDALNSALPKSIAIIKTEEAGPDFHSRFSAKSKIYEYNILNSKIPDPFLEKYSWRVPYKLDFNLIKKEAHFLLGRHDFKSFQASDSSSSSQSSLSSPRLSAAALAKAGKRESIRTISDIHIKKAGKRITVRIEGNGFLYNMVRNIVGTLIDVGRGYLSAGSMKKILKSKDRTKAGPTAPAKGLFLIKVKY